MFRVLSAFSIFSSPEPTGPWGGVGLRDEIERILNLISGDSFQFLKSLFLFFPIFLKFLMNFLGRSVLQNFDLLDCAD